MWYADASPHYSTEGCIQSSRAHLAAEQAALGKNFDWLHLCRCATSRRISIVTFLPETATEACAPFYSLLGPLVLLPNTNPRTISNAIMSTFLIMMHEDPPAPLEVTQGRLTPRHKDVASWEAHIATITGSMILPSAAPILQNLKAEDSAHALCASAPQVAQVLSATLPRLPGLLKGDAVLRALAVEHLMRLATPQRVCSLMTNAALGKVWRAVAAFRRHDERVAKLCDAFGTAVQGNDEMRAWVESTYNMQV